MSRWLSAILTVTLTLLTSVHAQSPASDKGVVVVAGTVVDDQLRPTSGVTVSLVQAGVIAARTLTDAGGAYRMANVRPGGYVVRATADGFRETSRALTVSASTSLIQLPLVIERLVTAPAPVEAPSAITVSAAPPVVDTRQTSTGGTFSRQTTGLNVGGSGSGAPVGSAGLYAQQNVQYAPPVTRDPWTILQASGETYDQFEPNHFQRTIDRPLSTFGADVDTASYANARRFLSSGHLPPAEAIRVEEFINYFHFGYANARDGRPMSLTTEIADCPWAPSHKLVLIGAKGAVPPTREIAGRNLVLLIDVSGSMGSPDRLPLIKTALGLFVDTLKPEDSLAIVTYAGTSGIALPPTSAQRRNVIQNAIARLEAGGSTNGASGLIMAYRTAREAFISGGVNRVILATDGDFNVGVTSHDELLRLIERERNSGVFLSVLGVGSGNLKDATMEMLADKGNGNYSYLDSLQEARRVLIREGDATLDAVAKDVKFQVEFNPAMVLSWKLIGYENRKLAARDFNDDRKDAGEMGAGHTVTALYEVIPVGVNDDGDRPGVDPLKYQPSSARPQRPTNGRAGGDNANGEWLTVKARYKQPESHTSELMSTTVRSGGRAQFLPLASAVAEFGLLLRDASHDIARWDALTRRLASIDAPAALAVEFAELKELVATARGLARLR